MAEGRNSYGPLGSLLWRKGKATYTLIISVKHKGYSVKENSQHFGWVSYGGTFGHHHQFVPQDSGGKTMTEFKDQLRKMLVDCVPKTQRDSFTALLKIYEMEIIPKKKSSENGNPKAGKIDQLEEWLEQLLEENKKLYNKARNMRHRLVKEGGKVKKSYHITCPVSKRINEEWK